MELFSISYNDTLTLALWTTKRSSIRNIVTDFVKLHSDLRVLAQLPLDGVGPDFVIACHKKKERRKEEPSPSFWQKEWPYILEILWLSCRRLESVWMVSGWCLAGVWRVSGWCPNIFWTKNNFFGPQFFGSTFLGSNIFGRKTFFYKNFFSGPKLFLSKKFSSKLKFLIIPKWTWECILTLAFFVCLSTIFLCHIFNAVTNQRV